MAKAEPPKKPAGDQPEGKEKAGKKPQAESAPTPAATPEPAKGVEQKPQTPANENKTAADAAPAQAPANENQPQPEKPAAEEEVKAEKKAEAPQAETTRPAEEKPQGEKPADPQAAKEDPAATVPDTAPEAEKPQAEGEKKGLKQKITDWVKGQFADKEGEEKRSMKAKVFEKGVDAVGFGDILRAWRSPENRVRNVLKSIGSKAADMVAGRIVSMTFRMIAVTWVAGIIGGVSTFGGLALLALATGAASSIYTYSKDFLHDKFYGPKDKRKDVKFIDKKRLVNAGIAFGTGTLMGALGAWLAKTGIVQNLFAKIGDAIFGGIEAGKGAVTDAFNMSAAPPRKTIPLVQPVSHAFAAALHPAAIPAPAALPVAPEVYAAPPRRGYAPG